MWKFPKRKKHVAKVNQDLKSFQYLNSKHHAAQPREAQEGIHIYTHQRRKHDLHLVHHMTQGMYLTATGWKRTTLHGRDWICNTNTTSTYIPRKTSEKEITRVDEIVWRCEWCNKLISCCDVSIGIKVPFTWVPEYKFLSVGWSQQKCRISQRGLWDKN